MTIKIKATEQYFLVVLFIMLYKVVLTFESVTEQNFLVVLFNLLSNHVLTFSSVKGILQL